MDKYIIKNIRKNGNLLQNVENQTPEICLAAVKQNGLALEYILKTKLLKYV